MGWASRYIENLNNGKTVSFRPRGHSMKGKIESGQLCTVVPVDLSEIFAATQRLDTHSDAIKLKLKEISAYASIPQSIQIERITKQAKLSVALEKWMRDNKIDAAAIQCWTSVQENYGCAACLSMSMLGEKIFPVLVRWILAAF